jgi:hypothetical protein
MDLIQALAVFPAGIRWFWRPLRTGPGPGIRRRRVLLRACLIVRVLHIIVRSGCGVEGRETRGPAKPGNRQLPRCYRWTRKTVKARAKVVQVSAYIPCRMSSKLFSTIVVHSTYLSASDCPSPNRTLSALWDWNSGPCFSADVDRRGKR